MHTPTHTRRHYAALSILTLVASFLSIPMGYAAGSVSIEWRPHCSDPDIVDNEFGGPIPEIEGIMTLTDGERCPKFAVRDPSSLQTSVLKKDDILDIDLMINNQDREDINRFRAWIAYDPTVLEGIDITISTAFPIPTPGEVDFMPSEGTVKIAASTEASLDNELIRAARVRFRVLADTYDGTPLTFIEASGNADAKSGIFSGEPTAEDNVMQLNPGSLYVRLAGASQTSSVQSSGNNGQTESATSTMQGQTSSGDGSGQGGTSSATPSAVFTLLQVQGLRVTTDGSTVYLAWDALPSSELTGYNIYYGTISGQYLQRRGVDKSATSMTIRALPIGTTYYFAIRGVNGNNEETAFSNEVGISVGNPRTSTSPLTGDVITKTPGTGGEVAGETGLSSTLLMLLAFSAVIGTLIAFRRQIRAS